MNAISPQSAEPGADILAQQSRRCAELADMALQLARIVFQKSIAELSEATPTQNMPAQPLATGSALLFLRLAAFARQTTQLEARLTGSLPPARTARAPTESKSAESKSAESQSAASPHPARNDTTRHPPANAPTAGIGSLFDTVCQELGIQKDEAKMPAAFLPASWQEGAYPDRR